MRAWGSKDWHEEEKEAFRGHATEELIPDPAVLPTRLMTPKVDLGLKANAVERRPQATGIE